MGSIRKKRATYEARYRDPAGNSRSKSFPTKAEARTFLAAVETEKARGTFIDPQLARTPFGPFGKEYLESRIKIRPATRAKYELLFRTQIEPYFETAPIGAVRQEHVEAWVKKLSDRYSPATIRQSYALLGAIFGRAVRRRLIAESPCHKVELPEMNTIERRFLTAQEVERLAVAFEPRYRALVYAAAYLGCRWEELAALRRDRLDLLRREVRIEAVIERAGGTYSYVEKTKTDGSRRTLQLPDFLVTILAQHFGHAPDSEWVFPSARGGFLRYDNFRVRTWNPAVKRAGLAPLTFHALRHTHAALLIDQGADPVQVQRRLGHTDIKTTLGTYGHRFPNKEGALNEALGDVYRAVPRPSVGNTWDGGSDGDVVELSFGEANDG